MEISLRVFNLLGNSRAFSELRSQRGGTHYLGIFRDRIWYNPEFARWRDAAATFYFVRELRTFVGCIPDSRCFKNYQFELGRCNSLWNNCWKEGKWLEEIELERYTCGYNLSDSETKNLKLNGFLNWHNDVWIIFRLNNMKEIQAFFKIIIKFVGKENIIYWFLKMKNRNRSIEKFCNKKKSYIFSDL